MRNTRKKRSRKSCVHAHFSLIFANDTQEVDEGDLRTLDALLPSNAGERRTLADIIFSKLDESGEEEKTTTIQKTHRGKSTGHRSEEQ
jgi:hypothetical protein